MENLQAVFREYLQKDESLLWVGKPKQGVQLKTSDIFVIPFSILWLGFAVFWTVGATKSGGVLFGLFGIPFVLIGLMIAFGRFTIDSYRRKNTVYGLTESRVIIRSGIFSVSVTSRNIHLQEQISLTEGKGNYGTISFGGDSLANNVTESMSWWPGVEVNPSLESIEEAKNVYNRIIRLQQENR